jgi:hypothetical protein
VPVAHTCDPSYLGGRDQEASPGDSLLDPISKKPIIKKGDDGVAQGGDPEFKPQYLKKERKKEGRELSI